MSVTLVKEPAVAAGAPNENPFSASAENKPASIAIKVDDGEAGL